jgi:hypothetical protein
MPQEQSQPNSDGRTSDGKFAPGNSPGGCRKGSRHKVTLAVEALLEGEHEALTRKAIDKALEGDATALRLCLDRIAPPRKDAPVAFELPPIKSAGDAVEASSALLAAMAAGDRRSRLRDGAPNCAQGHGRDRRPRSPH